VHPNQNLGHAQIVFNEFIFLPCTFKTFTMRTSFLGLLLFLISAPLIAQNQEGIDLTGFGLRSPNGQILLRFNQNQSGGIQYTALTHRKIAVNHGELGLTYAPMEAKNRNYRDSTIKFFNKLVVIGLDSSVVKDSWAPVLGEVDLIKNEYRQVILTVKDTEGTVVAIHFRVFNDGVAFRYEMLQASGGSKRIVLMEEKTSFDQAKDNESWWLPGDYDTNEYAYRNSKISAANGIAAYQERGIAACTPVDTFAIQTPLLMKSDSGLYIVIHEAALTNYPAMLLIVEPSKLGLKVNLVKDALRNAAYLDVPFRSPWRVVLFSEKATDLPASKTILNLNEPSKIVDQSWIKPVKYVGVWWEMHIGKGSWDYASEVDGVMKPHNHHAANTTNVKRYIDFASLHGFDGVLVEGWNQGWENWFNKSKDDLFDFVTPYPDFNPAALQAYAAQKNVSLIMHHETSSAANNYERQMDTAYNFMHKYGYKAVKTGYVGRIIPRGEAHDGQYMVQHYERVAARCAQEKFMVNMHECVRPTGQHRTWPNWFANEACRGQEYCNDPRGIDPEHETLLPFMRCMGGPIDYTPGMFEFDLAKFDKTRTTRVKTTLAKQLALYVTIYSPLQMAADLPENYEKHLDAFQFIKDVPLNWSDSKYLQAEPGDFMVVARREKNKNNWYLGAVTDENPRTLTVPLDFLTPGKKYKAVIYQDAPTAHYLTNPAAYDIQTLTLTSKSELKLKLAAGGGAAVQFVEL
jgi:glucan 1,4-alpha-glucosidase